MLVVEHDEAIMRQADWLIDMGPGAGRQRRANRGPRARRRQWPPTPIRSRAVTCRRERIPVPSTAAAMAKTRAITLEGVTTNNLKNVDRAVPAFGVGVRHRRKRIGQEFAAQRNVGPGAGRAAWAASLPSRARIRACAARAKSTRWSRSTSRPSAARRGAIRPPIPACSTKSAKSLPTPATPGSAATRRADSASTSRAGGARSARGKGSRGSK